MFPIVTSSPGCPYLSEFELWDAEMRLDFGWVECLPAPVLSVAGYGRLIKERARPGSVGIPPTPVLASSQKVPGPTSVIRSGPT